MDQGWSEWINTVGIRADEQRRIKPEDDKQKDRWYTWQPLNHAKVTRHMVVDFWRRMPFDLRLDAVNGNSALGNCDGCFLKSERTLAMLARDYPERHEWWERQEANATQYWSELSEVTRTKILARRIGKTEWLSLPKSARRKAIIKQTAARFRSEYTRQQLSDFVSAQGDWIFDDENDALCQTDHGECTG